MATWPILSVTTFLPMVGVLFIAMLKADEAGARNARWVALWTTLITLAVSLNLVWRFDPGSPEFQFVEKHPWLAGFATYHMGVDGISLPLIILTTAIMPLCIAASWRDPDPRPRIHDRVPGAGNLDGRHVLRARPRAVLSVLRGRPDPDVPDHRRVGRPRRVYASFKFFLYTLAGSVLMLLAIMAMYWQSGTTDITVLLRHAFPRDMQPWLWMAFFASFAVKLPMWPVHTWLPDAHVEAPTAGSVVLAAILLKMGGYGFLRFSLPMFPAASADFAPFMFALSVIAIIYTSLVALVQEDMKKLIAYSSVAHMGFVTMGIFAATSQGVAGGIFQMVSHGVVSAALFLCVGVVYDRMHSREISTYGGLVNRMPVYAAVFCCSRSPTSACRAPRVSWASS